MEDDLPYTKIRLNNVNGTVYPYYGDIFCNYCGMRTPFTQFAEGRNCFPAGVPEEFDQMVKNTRRYLAVLTLTRNHSHIRSKQCPLTRKRSPHPF